MTRYERDIKLLHTENQLRVYEILRKLEKSDRITREKLVERTGLSDRDVREVIETMRRCGVRVVSGMGKPGYRLMRDDEPYEKFEREYVSRAYKVIANNEAMKRNNPLQQEMEA